MKELNKEELLEAIDSYNLLTPKSKTILKTLINLSIDNSVIITIKDLSEICKVSRVITYKAITIFEEKKLIELKKRDRSRLSEFILQPKNLNQIIKHYEVYMKAKNN